MGEVSVRGERRSDAFSEFYGEHRVEMSQLAWLLCHDAEMTQDVVHEAFASMYPRFATIDRPGAYLRRCVVNGVYERSRRRRRESGRLRTEAASLEAHAPGPTGGLVDVVAVLGVKARTAIVLRYWGGLTDLEIADAMQIKPATARSILSRALKRLREEIE